LLELSAYTIVKKELKQVEEKMRKQVLQDYKDLIAAFDLLLSTGGKRIRPTLTLLIGKMLGGDKHKLITLAAAIEMLHTATLVHDDLIDGALLRRGNSTINSRWSPSATVLTGDYLFARAAGLAAQADSLVAMRLFADTLAIIVNGEISQLFTKYSTAHLPTADVYFQRIQAKTASLFRTSCMVAAIVSPVEEKVIETVGEFGLEIGTAFQIIDDILDFVGDASVVGKPIGRDLEQGIITLPVIYYFEEHPQKKDFLYTLNKNADVEISRTLIEQIKNSSAIQRALNVAHTSAKNALQALSILPENAERKALEELTEHLISRNL